MKKHGILKMRHRILAAAAVCALTIGTVSVSAYADFRKRNAPNARYMTSGLSSGPIDESSYEPSSEPVFESSYEPSSEPVYESSYEPSSESSSDYSF